MQMYEYLNRMRFTKGRTYGRATGGWEKLIIDDLHNLKSLSKYYYSGHIKEDLIGTASRTHRKEVHTRDTKT
jgi:hypothetical protein